MCSFSKFFVCLTQSPSRFLINDNLNKSIAAVVFDIIPGVEHIQLIGNF